MASFLPWAHQWPVNLQKDAETGDWIAWMVQPSPHTPNGESWSWLDQAPTLEMLQEDYPEGVVLDTLHVKQVRHHILRSA